jgi:hypothetical protein
LAFLKLVKKSDCLARERDDKLMIAVGGKTAAIGAMLVVRSGVFHGSARSR